MQPNGDGTLPTLTVYKRNSVMLGTAEVTTYHYDAVGNRSEVDLPNGVVTRYAYDDLNRLTNLTHTAGLTLNASYRYQLDATGRRTNAVEVLKQESGNYRTNVLSWAYDGMYRLTNEVSVSTSPDGNSSYTNAFGYDLAGNRVTQVKTTSTGASTVNYIYDKNDRLTNENSGAITYQYDANGSLTNKTDTSGTTSYAYDAMNKLVNVSGPNGSASYRYNEQGIRVSQNVGGTVTKYLIDANNHTGYAQVLEELVGGSATPNMSYVIGDEVLAQCGTTATAPQYFLMDGHGNNRQLTQMDASVADHYSYDAFGNVQSGISSSAANAAPTSKLYCGEQYDSTLQMYNLRARYYNPANGRFNQMDTFAGNNDDPITLHKYLYGNCDPVNVIDPSGNQGLVDLLVTSAIIGVLAGALLGGIANGWKGAAYGAVSGLLIAPLAALAIFGGGIGLSALLGVSAAAGTFMAATMVTAFFIALQVGQLKNATTTRQKVAAWLGIALTLIAYGYGSARMLIGPEGIGPGARVNDHGFSIRSVNPTGGTINCQNCAIATRATLNGNPAVALDITDPDYVPELDDFEKAFADSPHSAGGFQDSSAAQIESELQGAGSGSQGIVYVYKTGAKFAHVFNAVNQGGTVRFLDGQSGGVADFTGYDVIKFMRTD